MSRYNYHLWNATNIESAFMQVEDMIRDEYGEDAYLKIDDCYGVKVVPHDGSLYYTPHGEIIFNFSTVIL